VVFDVERRHARQIRAPSRPALITGSRSVGTTISLMNSHGVMGISSH
jgi:hypothetical protein